MRLDIFQPLSAANTGGTASPTSSSATVTPGFTDANPAAGFSILITNVGTDVLMIEIGTSAITASATTSTPILPNDKQIFSWNIGQSFAHRGVTGSGSTLYWKLGYGA